MTIGYIRSTHDENGRFHPYPAEAVTFWHECGEQVGRLLRPETPLTFAQLYLAYEEAADEHIATCPESELLTIKPDSILCEAEVAVILTHLLACGLAAAVPFAPPYSDLAENSVTSLCNSARPAVPHGPQVINQQPTAVCPEQTQSGRHI